ncbi:Vesicle transport through interaction with t-SNAREs 1B [Balamuthia mandrillaris]
MSFSSTTSYGSTRSTYGNTYNYQQDRNNLFAPSRSDRSWDTEDVAVLHVDQRSGLLQSNMRVDDHSERLQNTHRTALQSEHIGREIQATLAEQGDTLRRARDKNELINENMRSTRRIAMGMGRQLITNKIILIFLIVLLVVSIGVVAYLRWGRGLIKKLH